MYWVYAFRYLPDNRLYIGITNNILRRFEGHASGGKTAFDRFFKKHIDNFTLEIICTCEDESTACALERHVIKKLNTMVPFGFNMTAGGNGTKPKGNKPVVNLDTGKCYASIDEASIDICSNRSTMEQVLRGETLRCKGYRWGFLHDLSEMPEKKEVEPRKTSLSKWVKNVETGEIFHGVGEAGKSIGKSGKCISNSILEKDTCGGYHWENAVIENNYIHTNIKKKVVLLDRGIVFTDIKEASSKTQVSIYSIRQSIRIGCRGGGFRWNYLDNITEDQRGALSSTEQKEVNHEEEI